LFVGRIAFENGYNFIDEPQNDECPDYIAHNRVSKFTDFIVKEHEIIWFCFRSDGMVT
jgi:hypothetical protein